LIEICSEEKTDIYPGHSIDLVPGFT